MKKKFKKYLLTPLYILQGTSCFSAVHKNNKEKYRHGIQNISGDEAYKLITSNPSMLILDVRTLEEYNMGHIKNAVLIPYTELQSRIGEIINFIDKPVLVYCRSGKRGSIAANILLESGFKNIYHLFGGLLAWNYPLVKG